MSDSVHGRSVSGRAQTSTPFYDGGPRAEALATADGWNVNVHFVAGEDTRTYVFDVTQAELFLDSFQRALSEAGTARRSP